MKRVPVFLAFALAAAASAAPLITVVPSLGPNPNGSPNFAAYAASAIATLEDETAQAVSTVLVSDLMVTDYPSWRGTAITNPASPFAAESGTTLFFGVRILDPDATFRLADLRVQQYSTDPYDYFGYGAGYDTTTYSATQVGVVYAADGSRTYLRNGEDAAAQVNELILVGLAGAFDASTIYGYTPDQSGLDAAIRDYSTLGNFTIVTCYAIGEDPGACGSVDVRATPEPASLALAAAALLLAAGTRANRCLRSR